MWCTYLLCTRFVIVLNGKYPCAIISGDKVRVLYVTSAKKSRRQTIVCILGLKKQTVCTFMPMLV